MTEQSNPKMTMENEPGDTVPVVSPQPPVKSRRLFRRMVIPLSVLAVLVLVFPAIVSVTGLHNRVLGRMTKGQDLSVTADSASLTWWSPVTLHHVDVERHDQSWAVRAERFSTDNTLLQLLMGGLDMSRLNMGTVSLDRPHVVLRPEITEVSDDEAGTERRSSGSPYPTLRTVVRDGSIEIRATEDVEPVLAVDGISFVARTETVSDRSLLIVEPVRLFDHRELTRELCDQGLQLIAPMLSRSAYVNGEVTVHLDDVRIPLGRVPLEERLRLTAVSGRMQLHQVETGLRNPLLAEVASVLAAISGRRFTSVGLSEQTQIEFQVQNGRVHHQGLILLIPELSRDLTVTTSGWVDLNENIAIRMVIDFSGAMPSANSLLAGLARTPLELDLTGTIQQPRVRLPAGRSVLDELAGRLDLVIGDGQQVLPDSSSGVSGAVSDLVGGLVGDNGGKPDVQKTARGIFDLIQTFRKDSASEASDR